MKTVILAMMLVGSLLVVAPTAAADHCSEYPYIVEAVCRASHVIADIESAADNIICDLTCP